MTTPSHNILLISALFFSTLFPPSPALAHPLNSLIKGSEPAVYFTADDGKRYVFPTSSVFASWYPESATVLRVSDTELAAIPLGGNVMYRPGATLVKITTDPRVYAVSRYGVLRWITSEALAATLYGSRWNKNVVDIPDVFFTNYIIGAPIVDASSYAADAELRDAQTPQQNFRPRFSAEATDSASGTLQTPSSSQPTLAVNATSDQIQMNATPLTAIIGSRVSFSSDATKIGSILNHKIYALISGEPQPVLWKDCGATNYCAESTPFYRTTSLYSQVTVGGQMLASAPIAIQVVGGDPPKATLAVQGRPAKNQVTIDVQAPFGEMINTTALVDGTKIEDKTLALCQGNCSITLQINVPGSITAFTWVGGKYERSNTITVTPE